MAIKKQYLKSKPVCKVTFSLLSEEANDVKVLGCFNDWNEEKALTLKKSKNGTFKGTLDLEKDSTHEFRYLVDGAFQNDDQADAYKANGLGSENGVLNV